MAGLLRDLRFSVRKIARRPILSAIIVLSMAIGIGATTVVYGLVQGAFLRPYIFPDLNRLVFIWAHFPMLHSTTEVLSDREFELVGEQTDIIENRGAAYGLSLTLTSGDGEPERLRGEQVTIGWFETLGVKPYLGRWLQPEDVDRQTNPSVLLSYRLWQRRFGGDPDLVGRTIQMSDLPHTVVGIMPPRFRFARADVWGAAPSEFGPDRILWTATRLKEGVSIEQANAVLEVLARRMEQEYIGEVPEYENWRLWVEPMRDYFIGDVKPGLFILMSAAAFVLLIVCLNVANLLLAGAFGRGREIAARITLGAHRGRVIRLMLTETMVLVVLGGALGLLFAHWGLGVVGAMIPQEYLPAARLFDVDGPVLAVTLAVTVFAGLFVGAIPALKTSKPNLQEALKEGGRGAAGGRGGRFLLNALVVIEVAAALVLLVGLGLMRDGFASLQSRDTGFDPENVVTFHLHLPEGRYEDWRARGRFWIELEQRLNGLQEVEAAGHASTLPLEEYLHPVVPLSIVGSTEEQTRIASETVWYAASPGFFEALRIPREQGRYFTYEDWGRSQLVVMVNRAFVRRFLPGEDNPVGRQIRLRGSPPLTIVGVLHDAVQRRLTEEAQPATYQPLGQTYWLGIAWMRWAVRSPLELPVIMRSVREEIAAMDPVMPAFNVQALTDTVHAGFGGWRLCVVLLTVFAGLALLLAAIGIYGVISFSVSQRAHEIGIRMAMGARRGKILGTVLGHGLRLTVIGVAAGTIVAYYLSRFLATLALEVTTAQPLTYGVVAVFLIAVTLVACSIPGWRATRVSPVDALREE